MNDAETLERFYSGHLRSTIAHGPQLPSLPGITMIEYVMPSGEIPAPSGAGQFAVHLVVEGWTTLQRKVGPAWEAASLGPGSATLSPPGHWSQAKWIGTQRRFSTYITSEAIARLTATGTSHDMAARIHGDLDLQDRAITAMLEILRAKYWDASPFGRRIALESLVAALCVDLLGRHSSCAIALHKSSMASDWRVRRACEYLDDHLDADVALDELASQVELSASHVCALFRSATGLSPHRWLMKRRVERASQMLLDPRQSVTGIAHALGFASSQHLATVFKKHMGATPTGYRRERLS